MIPLYCILFLFTAIALSLLLWPVRQNKKFCIWVTVLFFTGAFGVYALVGSPGIVPLIKERDARLAQIKETITRDSALVETDPNNLGAWVELGVNFMATGQYDAAANAFRQSVVISKGAPALILAYAKAEIARDNGEVNDLAQKSLKMVLLQEPKNEEARYWLAVKELQDGKTAQAMKDMKALYHSLPDDSPVHAMIDQQIGK